MTAGELDAINSAFWIMAIITTAYALLPLTFWVFGWAIRFAVFKYEAGRHMWFFSAILWLLSVSSIIANIGSASREWWQMPPTTVPWWPSYRYLIALALAIITTRLAILLVRRWRTGGPFTVEIPQNTFKRTK